MMLQRKNSERTEKPEKLFLCIPFYFREYLLCSRSLKCAFIVFGTKLGFFLLFYKFFFKKDEKIIIPKD